MAERELGIVIRAKDLASRTIAGVNRQLSNIGSNVARGLGNAVRNVERGIAAVGAAAIGGLAYSLKAAGDFEAQLNTINTVAQVTPEVLGEIGEGIRKLARDTGTSHADLTTAYYDLVSAGIKAADAQNVLTAANTLAIGGLSTTSEAVDLLTTAINSYGGDATKAGQYADQFAQSIAAGKVTAAELAASFAQVGPMAAAMGIGVDEISASIGLMTAKGTPAAEAFTQIRAAMVALQRQTPEMTRVLNELGIADAQLYADTYGLAPLFDKLRTKADELGIPLIDLTGRVEGAQYALQNTGPEFANYIRNLEDVADSSGTAADQMSERQQGLNYQLGRVRTLAHDAGITIGNALLPKITPLVEKFAEWIAQNQTGIGTFATQVADGVERAAKWALSLDWGMISSTLRTAAGYAKGLVEAFLGMPSWIQVAVVSGWGLNKLTGGALGSILGQVLLGGTKGLLGGLRGSTPVTPMYTKEVGLGGGPGGGGGAGNLLGLATAIGGGVAVGLAVGVPIFRSMVDPAKEFEQGQVDRIIGTNDPSRIREAVRILDDELAFWREKPPQVRAAMQGVINEFQAQRDALATSLPVLGPPLGFHPKYALRPGFSEARNASGPPAVLPDTAMAPVTNAVGGVTAQVQQLPPILDRANATLKRVAGIGDRQQAQLVEQGRRLGSIEFLSGRIASSSAITAAKNFTATAIIHLTTHTALNLDGRSVASQTLYRLAASGVDPAFRAPT